VENIVSTAKKEIESFAAVSDIASPQGAQTTSIQNFKIYLKARDNPAIYGV
jgi:hypothetical protein